MSNKVDPEMMRALGGIMQEMRGMFPSHFRLTLVARNASLSAPDNDVMITEDTLDKVIPALQRIESTSMLSRGLMQ